MAEEKEDCPLTDLTRLVIEWKKQWNPTPAEQAFCLADRLVHLAYHNNKPGMFPSMDAVNVAMADYLKTGTYFELVMAAATQLKLHAIPEIDKEKANGLSEFPL